MIIFKRIVPYIATALATIMLLVGTWYPYEWRNVAIGLIILPLVAIIAMRQSHWRSEYIGLSISNIMLLLSAYTFILIQESSLMISIITAITIIFYFLFLKNLSIFLFQPAKYIAYSLEHISKYSNVVASFFVYTSIFMFFVLGLGRLRYFVLAAAMATLILTWQTFWIQKVPLKRSLWFILVITSLMVEGIWALHFWPTSFFVSGGMLTIGFYMLLHISRLYLTEVITRAVILRFIIISIVTITILLATAQWGITY